MGRQNRLRIERILAGDEKPFGRGKDPMRPAEYGGGGGGNLLGVMSSVNAGMMGLMSLLPMMRMRSIRRAWDREKVIHLGRPR